MRRALLFVGMLLAAGTWLQAPAQQLGIGYYDVDRLYDTVPSPFYDDADYTPGGRLRWNGERYRRKIARTAAVIDSLALPLVALFGVENEAVVRDLARSCRSDYTYLHRTLNRFDGLDFALLYYSDCFFPHYTETGNSYLYIEGTLPEPYAARCDTLGLLLCRDPRLIRLVPRQLRRERRGAKLLLLGRLDPGALAAAGLREVTARAAGAGHGNVWRRGRWELRDRIAADTALRMEGCNVYLRRWLLDPQRGTPLPTYELRSYRGGYGSRLPVFGYILLP